LSHIYQLTAYSGYERHNNNYLNITSHGGSCQQLAALAGFERQVGKK